FWRRELVVLPVADKHRALDAIGHTCESELLQLLHRGLHIGNTQHPGQLEMRSRGFSFVRLHRFPALLPYRMVVVVRAPRHQGAVALFECSDARRVVSARAIGHDRDAPWIDVLAARDVFIRWGTGSLIMV